MAYSPSKFYSFYFFRFFFGSDKPELAESFMGMLESDGARTRGSGFVNSSILPAGCRITPKEQFQFRGRVSGIFSLRKSLIPAINYLKSDVIDLFVLEAPNESILINWYSICILSKH